MKRKLLFSVTIGCSLLMMTACELKVTDDSNEKSTCAVPEKKKTLGVVGGIPDPHIFPTSLMLSIANEDGSLGTCTGAFISDSLLLTAGHCLKHAIDLYVSSPFEPFNGKAVGTKNYIIHSDYKEETRSVVDEAGNTVEVTGVPPAFYYADIGIARFPAGTAPERFIARLASSLPAKGQDVYVVGYGNNTINTTGNGIKRFGKNKIADIIANLSNTIVLQGPRHPQGQLSDYNAVSVGEGDSGGALYNVNGEILGTASSKLLPPDFPDSILSVYTNVNEPKTKSFLDPFLKDLEKPADDMMQPEQGPKQEPGSAAPEQDGTDSEAPQNAACGS